MLAATRPEGEERGLGHDVTIRRAVQSAEPQIADAFRNQPRVEASIRATLGATYIYSASSSRRSTSSSGAGNCATIRSAPSTLTR